MAVAMRRCWLLGAIASCSLMIAIAEAEPAVAEMPWRTDVRAAFAEARAQRSPLWLQFTGSHCPSCRRMELEVFTDPRVVAMARERFVPVQISADASNEWAGVYGVAYLPTTVLLDPDGRVVGRQQGFLAAPLFLTFLSQAAPSPAPAATSASASPAAPRASSATVVAKPDQPRRQSERRTVAYSRGASQDEPLALGGHCPVTLVAHSKLRLGSARIAARYDGMIYRFVDEAARDVFLKRPDPYVPVSYGRCPVSQRDQGRRVAGRADIGAVYQSQLYLFADDKARRAFMDDPRRYADFMTADGGRCPHCRTTGGAEVEAEAAGKSEHAVIYRGVRYLFPNEEHRIAFLKNPRRYIAPTITAEPDLGPSRSTARFVPASASTSR